MKYNTVYTPIISLKDTIIETDYVMKKITSFYNNKFSLIKLIPPMFIEENSDLLINVENITRPITFDTGSEYKVGQLFLFHSNWIRKMIENMKLKENEGIEIFSSTLWRDIKINPISSITKNNFIFQIKVNSTIDIKKIVRNEVLSLYKFIQELESELSKKYKINTIIPQKVNIVSSQMLENEYPNIKFHDREVEMIHELNSFILENPGNKLFSGHIHREIPVELYAQKNYYEILIKDFINSSTIEVASVAQIASGIILDDQLSVNSKSEMKALDFYANEIKKEYNVIEIKINIGKLMMSILKKGHITEVQSGIISDESNIIKSRYKIEKY